MQSLALVIPCYNESRRLNRALLTEWLGNHPQVTVFMVDDGSSDDTPDMIKELSEQSREKIIGVFLPQNSGKAEAVRKGLLAAYEHGSFNYIGYWDADFSAPLDQVDWMLEFCGGQFEHVFVLGSRLARLGGHIKRRYSRHLLGRVFSSITSMVLGLTVYDTQCGAKFVKANEVPDLFGEAFISKWLFDVEILARLIEKYGRTKVYENALEVPLKHWTEIAGSKLKPFDFLKAPLELLQISRHYKL